MMKKKLIIIIIKTIFRIYILERNRVAFFEWMVSIVVHRII